MSTQTLKECAKWHRKEMKAYLAHAEDAIISGPSGSITLFKSKARLHELYADAINDAVSKLEAECPE